MNSPDTSLVKTLSNTTENITVDNDNLSKASLKTAETVNIEKPPMSIIPETKYKPVASMIQHVLKNCGPNGGELRIESLDGEALKLKLASLENELNDVKMRCVRLRAENEWYREEIETSRRDTGDYILYLEAQHGSKQNTMDRVELFSKEMVIEFEKKRAIREQENEAKIHVIKEQILEFELKLESKKHEMLQLSDIMAKRAKHEAAINKIHQEIQAAESEHQQKLISMERGLLAKRIALQKEYDSKISTMEESTREQAAKYVIENTRELEAENLVLEEELKRLVAFTQSQLVRKKELEAENKTLHREQRIRQDLVRIRLERVKEAVCVV